MAEHELKTWPNQFRAILDGRKCFEVRHNDRDFDVGDTLLLKEYDPSPYSSEKYLGVRGYTRRELRVRVTYMLHGGQFGLPANMCVMSIEKARSTDKETT